MRPGRATNTSLARAATSFHQAAKSVSGYCVLHSRAAVSNLRSSTAHLLATRAKTPATVPSSR